MVQQSELPTIAADDFVRRFTQRAPTLMWFLGAGASAAAGIPTAGDMIWDFKQRLYVTQRGASLTSVADLSNSLVRDVLQGHIDGSARLPSPGAPDEYAALFEAVWSAERDRQSYIDSKIKGAKPSYGHIALATLMQADRARLAWTTNFDPLIADACARVYGGTGHLTTATPDAPQIVRTALENERWPVEIKLHGDFRSRRLRNTNDELRHQDALLRQAFVDLGQRYGLVVVGYSGRDESIIEAFDGVLASGAPFPSGLFWLHRGDGPVLARVEAILRRAADTIGPEAGIVRIENFDEILRDLIRSSPGLDTTVLDSFAADRKWRTPAPFPRGRKGWPVVRLNALQIDVPTVCRRLVCEIGGTREVREAIVTAGVDVIATRRKGGVLAFGRDEDVKTAFAPYTIAEFDLHTVETQRLRYESAERGLLRDALARAIVRNRGLVATRARTKDFLTPADPRASLWSPLKSIAGGELGGVVPSAPELIWSEGVAIRLEWADDRLWLVFEPRIVFSGKTEENATVAADFGRERTVKRYNRSLNDLLAFWAGMLAGDGEAFSAFGIGDGVDAAFNVSPDTAYSRRAIP